MIGGTSDYFADHIRVLRELYKSIPDDIESAIREMELEGLNDTQEYQKLKDILSHDEFEVNDSIEELWGNHLKITRIFNLLQNCNDLVWQKKIDSVFERYKSPKEGE